MSEQDEMQNHATISKAGEVDFPAWVKVLAWIIGLCIPLVFAGLFWVGSTIFDMSIRMAKIETAIDTATKDQYRASDATAAHALLQLQIERNEQRIDNIEGRLGMRGPGGGRSEPTN